MSLCIEDLIWHDGQLVSVTQLFSEPTGSIVLDLNLYADDASSERISVLVTCRGVEQCALVLDFLELWDNRAAGHIAQGYVKKFRRKKKLRVNLMDGYVDITGASFDVALKN